MNLRVTYFVFFCILLTPLMSRAVPACFDIFEKPQVVRVPDSPEKQTAQKVLLDLGYDVDVAQRLVDFEPQLVWDLVLAHNDGRLKDFKPVRVYRGLRVTPETFDHTYQSKYVREHGKYSATGEGDAFYYAQKTYGQAPDTSSEYNMAIVELQVPLKWVQKQQGQHIFVLNANLLIDDRPFLSHIRWIKSVDWGANTMPNPVDVFSRRPQLTYALAVEAGLLDPLIEPFWAPPSKTLIEEILAANSVITFADLINRLTARGLICREDCVFSNKYVVSSLLLSAELKPFVSAKLAPSTPNFPFPLIADTSPLVVTTWAATVLNSLLGL